MVPQLFFLSRKHKGRWGWVVGGLLRAIDGLLQMVKGLRHVRFTHD